MVPFEQVERVVGTDLGGGAVTIEPYLHHLTADAVLSPPLPPGVAHPAYPWYAGMAGLSVTIEEIFSLVGASAEDGPMLGETTIENRSPLQVGATYRTEARIVGAERKSGKRAGTFDVVSLQIALLDEAGETAAVVTNRFVFPRRAAAP